MWSNATSSMDLYNCLYNFLCLYLYIHLKFDMDRFHIFLCIHVYSRLQLDIQLFSNFFALTSHESFPHFSLHSCLDLLYMDPRHYNPLDLYNCLHIFLCIHHDMDLYKNWRKMCLKKFFFALLLRFIPSRVELQYLRQNSTFLELRF